MAAGLQRNRRGDGMRLQVDLGSEVVDPTPVAGVLCLGMRSVGVAGFGQTSTRRSSVRHGKLPTCTKRWPLIPTSSRASADREACDV